MPAELERSFEAVAAKAAAEWANVGTRFDEIVVYGADAVRAADLAARPIAALGGRSSLRRDPRRRGRTFSPGFVSSQR
jgi:hypothetical protein